MTSPDLATGLIGGPLLAPQAIRRIFADRAIVARMLDFERCLALAESEVGLVPANAAKAIGRACDPDLYDLAALGEAAATAGNLPIPLVKALTATVAKTDPEAARFVHLGATSQDLVDTALVCGLAEAIPLVISDLHRGRDAFAALARAHRETPVVGRTLMQQAIPIPLGLKLAGYAAALHRDALRLRRAARDGLVLQFGGAAGTLAALGKHAMPVAERLAHHLGLGLPDAPWHTHRDRLVEIASALAIACGTSAKIARDVSLLMQNEVAEAAEPQVEGRGGSSTMPNKRNPVLSSRALAAGARVPGLMATLFSAMVQEHERGVGGWQAEWTAWPDLVTTVAGAIEAVADIAEGLSVDATRMRAGIDASNGLVMAEAVQMALAPILGKQVAHEVVAEGCREAVRLGRSLAAVLAGDPRVRAHVDDGALAALFDPLAYQGAAQAFIDRQLEFDPEE